MILYHYDKKGDVICDDVQQYKTECLLQVVFFNYEYIVSSAIACVLNWL
jgi:hypothetical protein